MRLHISYLAARQRSNGTVLFLKSVGSITAGPIEAAQVVDLYRQFMAPDGDKLRSKYSHIRVVVDNDFRGEHEFQDPEILKRNALEQELATARAELRRAQQSEVHARENAFTAALARGDSTNAIARVAQLESALGIASTDLPPDRISSEQPVTPLGLLNPCPPRAPGVFPDLEECTDEQLIGLAEAHSILLSADMTREKLIAALRGKTEEPESVHLLSEEASLAELQARCRTLGIDETGFQSPGECKAALDADERLSPFSVPELQKQAHDLGLNTVGLLNKQQLLPVIEARQKEAVELSHLSDKQLAKVVKELGIEPGATRAETEAAILKASS